MKTITIVLAGNYQQFKDWMHENSKQLNDRKYIYAYDFNSIRGLYGDVIVVKTGTWYNNPVYTTAFYMYMKARNYKDENKRENIQAANPEVSVEG